MDFITALREIKLKKRKKGKEAIIDANYKLFTLVESTQINKSQN